MGSSRDLEARIAELGFDAELTTDGFNVSAQSVELGAFYIALLDAGDAILADR